MMCFVGGQAVLKDEGGGVDSAQRFYMSVYPRLLNEVENVNEVPRIVGYRSYDQAGGFNQFFGIETDSIDYIPDGLVGWELGKEKLTVKNHGEFDITSIKWLWREEATGEFCSIPHAGDQKKWLMTTNCYITKNPDKADTDVIELVDYNHNWPVLFGLMKSRLLEQFGGIITRIEHYGSTAIAGMPAKPIIDILVEVLSFDIARRYLIPCLSGVSCEYWWYTDHIMFIVRSKPFGRRTHHIHIATKGHRIWEGIAFRDYLITNPDVAAQYAALKRQLSTEYKNDREKYTDAKTDFVRRITDKALTASI